MADIGRTTIATASEEAAKHSAQVVGNIGMFYVCYRLSRIGWNVMPTARNARGIDIIAYSSDPLPKFIGVQVKALSKKVPVPLGTAIEHLMGDWWIIVIDVVSETPTTFVMNPAEVKHLSHRGEREGRVSYWLQPRAYDQPHFRDQWSRLLRAI
jgi:hypothetical protein